MAVGKITAQINSEDLTGVMAIRIEGSSSGKHQPSVTGAQEELLTSHLAKGKGGLLGSQLLSRKQLFPSWSKVFE